MQMRTGCWIALAMLASCRSAPSKSQASAAGGYLKGQLHVHSSNSGDSTTSPEHVVHWYEDRKYDFIVFTDHNFITAVEGTPGRMLVIPGVELTQNLETCDPPPPPGTRACLLHVNALFVGETSSPRITLPALASPARRLDLYTTALDTTGKLGGLAQLNHPNFSWGADAKLIAELVKRGLLLFEVANESSGVTNVGDAEHPSTEALWDAVLSAGGKLYGVATDDAHYYDDADAARARGITPDTGDHGWVMVHATRDVAAIRDALARGDFYSSTGVVLRRIERVADALVIDVADDSQGDHDFVFIGSGGRILARAHGRSATFPLASVRGSFVRATVTDADGRKAWVQPIWP